MPDQNKKSLHRVPFYRRPIVVVLCLVVIIVIAVAVVLVVKAVSGEDAPIDEPTEETESALVYDEEGEDDNDLSPEDQKIIVQYEGENPNELDHLTGLITYTEVKDGTLAAMVSIDQYLTGGTCTANLKSNDQIVASAEQAIEADASTSHCGPITINLAGVSGGKYQLEVVISSGGKTGTAASNVEF